MRRVLTLVVLLGTAGIGNARSVCGLPRCSVRLSGLFYDPPVLHVMKVRLSMQFGDTGPDGEGEGFRGGTFRCRELSPPSHCVGHQGRITELYSGSNVSQLCPSAVDTTAGVGAMQDVHVYVTFPDGTRCDLNGITPREGTVFLPSLTGIFVCTSKDGTEVDRHYFGVSRALR